MAPVCRTVTSSTCGCRADVMATPLAVPSSPWVTAMVNRSRGLATGSVCWSRSWSKILCHSRTSVSGSAAVRSSSASLAPVRRSAKLRA